MKARIDEMRSVVERYKTEGLDADSYNKCLVCLSYEYLQAGCELDAINILASVPVEYFENVQLKQMEEDAMCNSLVINLSYKLIQAGLVEGTDEIMMTPNVPAARA